MLGLVHQRNGDAVRARASCAPDAVNVIFGLGGHFVVHHKRQLGDVQAARGNVGRHQHAQFARFELVEHVQPRLLRFVAMDGVGRQSTAYQIARDLVGGLFGFAEHDDLVHVQIHNQPFQQLAFAVAVYGDNVFFHVGVGGILRGDFHNLRRVHKVLRQLADGGGEGGGEQQRLARLGQHLHDGADVVDKTHVQHAVGFVQHHDFYFAQIDVFLFDVVQQPPHGGDDDFAAGAQIGGLLVHVYATKQHGVAQGHIFDVVLRVLVDLVGELARGREHQHPHGVHGGRCAGVGVAFEAF